VKNEIGSLLDKTGLKYEEHPDFYSTIWKISPNMKINIIISNKIHSEWIHILHRLGPLKEINPKLLLRLNNAVLGSKLSLDTDQNLICSSEIMQESATEVSLKQLITQVVKLVTLCYEKINNNKIKMED
jgi:hypothetical protein